MTGIDASAEILRYAKRNAPGATFLLSDAAEFACAATADAVVSCFDSVNHILDRPRVQQLFGRMRTALKPGGLLVSIIRAKRIGRHGAGRRAKFITRTRSSCAENSIRRCAGR